MPIVQRAPFYSNRGVNFDLLMFLKNQSNAHDVFSEFKAAETALKMLVWGWGRGEQWGKKAGQL